MPKITVWPNRFITGWDGGDADPVLLPVIDCLIAFREQYETHAHFVPYYLEGFDECPRINVDADKAVLADLRFAVGVADIDDREAHKEKRPTTPEWHKDTLEKIEALPFPVAWYATRSGYRAVWEYPQPLTLPQWVQAQKEFLERMLAFDLIADIFPWNQSYGLPFVVRQGEAQKLPASLGVIPRVEYTPILPAREGTIKGALAGLKDAPKAFKLPDAILEGDRARMLLKYAGKLRRQGLDYSDILTLVQKADRERCKPPIANEDTGAEELERLCLWTDSKEGGIIPADRETVRAEKEAKLTPAEKIKAHENIVLELPERIEPFNSGSEQTLAEWILSDVFNVEASTNVIYDRGCLWKYCEDHAIWEDIPPVAIRNLVGKLDRAFYRNGTTPNGEPRFAALQVTQKMRTNVTTITGDICAVKDFFLAAPDGLTFDNGFVEILDNQIKLSPKSANQRATHAMPYSYTSGATPTLWLRTLKEIWRDDPDKDEKIQTLREFMGACLLNQAARYKKAVIMIGEGANGKSIIQKVILAMFKGKAVAAVPPQDMYKEYNKAILSDARINIVDEMPDNDILDAGPVKALITGDAPVPARRIYGTPYNFIPTFGNLFNSNNLPMFKDMSLGFRRRWILLTFNRIFLDHEQDETRAKTIIDQELAAVVAWALDGAQTLIYRKGYDVPKSSFDMLEHWRETSDTALAYIKECCEPISLAETSTGGAAPGALYVSYTEWAKSNGHEKQMSSMTFYKRLARAGIGVDKDMYGRRYALRIKKKSGLR